jgi:hypothetical protein
MGPRYKQPHAPDFQPLIPGVITRQQRGRSKRYSIQSYNEIDIGAHLDYSHLRSSKPEQLDKQNY